MNKKNLENLLSKREYALALLKVWEEELEIKNEINNGKVILKEKNISPKIL